MGATTVRGAERNISLSAQEEPQVRVGQEARSRGKCRGIRIFDFAQPGEGEADYLEQLRQRFSSEK
jgi:hypothetical protein